MKKVLLGAALLPLSVIATLQTANASDGTIQFNGSIVDSPCVISSESKNQEVDMGAVKSSTFAATGDKSTAAPFQIKLEECDLTAGKTKVNVVFNGIGDDDDTSLLSVDNGAGSATGVGIGIFDAKGQAISLNEGASLEDLTEGNTTLNYDARYVSTKDAVTIGSANGQVDFSLTYE
ncbi:fimbrial protein [Trabulsiella odontotermitis]|uniref:Long polar fimbrial protein LpfA n=1 Tax=Trabulsiella odontotermitis TaxID=379893 RepID=A0A0L0H0D9_9ENTR|nr:fimbrial protein [Trabulsiella odontotermitis]KNC88192.1 long polar fimbrial protein LpfA [Trabulsiella odontotermitis]KNC94925.1 long polar fimbrial protein LpfA [Trabulsiella odontotermitis]